MTSIVVEETIVLSADWTATPEASSASFTSHTAEGSVRTFHEPPSRSTSSAPASSAAVMTASSSADPSTRITPRRLNCQPTAPGSAIAPPNFVNALRTSDAVRFLLSVRTSISIATPPGA